VDVLRRGDRKPPNGCYEDEPDQPVPEHCGHPMRGGQRLQLKSP
jgi:hypothetical protein